MSNLTYPAVEGTYEGDTLRPHESLPLSEQQKVWILVLPEPELMPPAREAHTPDEILRSAALVYEGLSPEVVREIEALALDRSRCFLGRN